jgi:hypothetical protein
MEGLNLNLNMVETTDNTSETATERNDFESLVQEVNYKFLADNKTDHIDPDMQVID